jgi:hypothetical protein
VLANETGDALERLRKSIGGLSQDFTDDVAVDVGQAALDAVVVDGQGFVVEPEQMQNGGVEVVHADGVLDRTMTKGIGGPIAEGGADPGSSQEDGEALGVVVAAARALLKGRHAPEFGDEGDQGIGEQSTLFQVADQSCTTRTPLSIKRRARMQLRAKPARTLSVLSAPYMRRIEAGSRDRSVSSGTLSCMRAAIS